MSSMEVSRRLLGKHTGKTEHIIRLKKRREEPKSVVNNDAYTWANVRCLVAQAAAEAVKNRPKSLHHAIGKEIGELGLEKSLRFDLDEFHRRLTFFVDINKMPNKKKLQELERNVTGWCSSYPPPVCSYAGQIAIEFKLTGV